MFNWTDYLTYYAMSFVILEIAVVVYSWILYKVGGFEFEAFKDFLLCNQTLPVIGSIFVGFAEFL